MDRLNNTWGFYKWYHETDDDNCIHPDDIEKFKKLFPVQLIFHCIDEDEEYITLKYENLEFSDTYRVKPLKYELLKEPNFNLGEQVKIKDTPGKNAVIHEIAWHFKQNDYMYFVSFDGKKKSKRYWSIELEKL